MATNPEAEADSERAWGQWWDVQYDLCQELDRRIAKAAAGRSDQFAAALVASLIEHLGERLRVHLKLPATDSRKEGTDGN